MTTTQNGYYKIMKGKRGFYNVLKSANNKVLSSTEWMHNKADVETNIVAQMRANNGTHTLVIDMAGKDEHMFFLDRTGMRRPLDYDFNAPLVQDLTPISSITASSTEPQQNPE